MDKSTAHKPVRLGWGEYEPVGGTASTADARARFLEAVRRIVPQVLADLGRQPLASFHALATELESSDYRTWQALVLSAEDEVPAALSLRDELLAWGHRYRLDADWCVDRALQTLRAWHRLPVESPLRSEWDHEAVGYFLPASAGQRQFIFEHPGWQLTADGMTQSDAERTIRASFEIQLSEYFESMRALAHAADLERTPEKRRLVHFDWLVYYQVELWSQQEIAAEAGVDRTTVRDALQTAARETGLTLRNPSRGGRPRNPNK